MGFIIPALIGAVGSVVGGLFNKSSQSSANRQNLQIAQMNNEFNERMLERQIDYNYDMFNRQASFSNKQLEKQNAFNEAMADKANAFTLSMWNKANEYNSPENQRARLESAGLNPYMMMNGGNAGTAQFASGTSASSGSSGMPSVGGINTPTATPVQVAPETLDLTPAANMLSRMADQLLTEQKQTADIANIDAMTEAQKIENKYKVSQIVSELQNRMADTRNKKLQSTYQNIINQFTADNQIADLKRKNQEVKNMKMSYELSQVEVAMRQEQLKQLPEQLRLSVATAYADISLKYAQGELTRTQAKHEIEKTLETMSKRMGIDLDNDLKVQISDDLVKKAQAEATRALNNAGPDTPFKLLHPFGSAVSSGFRYWQKRYDILREEQKYDSLKLERFKRNSGY